MSHLLDEILAQAANGSPATVALSAESVTVLLFASEFLENRENWLDKGVDPMDEVTDADWDVIEKLIGNIYAEINTPVDQMPIGYMVDWPAASPPAHWLLCNGQSLLRSSYPDLFAVLGTTYGAVDGTHFNVPDMRDRSPMMPGAGGVTALGQQYGSGGVTLSLSQIPSHDHDYSDTGHRHAQAIGAGLQGYQPTAGSGGFAFNGVTSGTSTPQVTGLAQTGIVFHAQGGNAPHLNVHPVLGLNCIIYAGV